MQPPDLLQFARDRRLSANTLRAFGVYSLVHQNRPALRYPTPLGLDRIKFLDGAKPKYTWEKRGGRPNWYGLAHALQLLQPGGMLHIVNGEPAVWACHTARVPAICVCAGEGTMPTAGMVADLAAHLSPMNVAVRVVYDVDQAGRRGGLKLAVRLRSPIPDTQALDLEPVLPGIPQGDVDDLHQQVGDELAKVLAGLHPLPCNDTLLPSSNPSRDDRDGPS